MVKLFPQARDKIRVLPNLVEGFSGEPADISDLQLLPRYWLVVGTREPRKNIPWFVSAWQTARQQSDQVPELVLIGVPEPLRCGTCRACTISAVSAMPNCMRSTNRRSACGSRPTPKVSVCRWSRP